MTLDEMTAQRDALLAARFRGVRTVEIDGRRVTYASDAEMASAITDIERRIAATQEGGRKRRLLTSVPATRRRLHRWIRGGACEPAAERFPAESRAPQHADCRGRSRHHGPRPLARAQQRVCGERDRELGR